MNYGRNYGMVPTIVLSCWVEAIVINKTQVVLIDQNSKAETYVIEVYENDSLTLIRTPVMTFNILRRYSGLPSKVGLIGASYSVRTRL
jgi:hypothetical protein